MKSDETSMNAMLTDMAKKAMHSTYSPYSGFAVGAAVLCGSGRIYTGTNIENASYGATVCAERTAIFKAVSEGERYISKIAIAGPEGVDITPCGICRQVIIEFCDTDTEVICTKVNGGISTYSISELLPFAFLRSELPVTKTRSNVKKKNLHINRRER